MIVISYSEKFLIKMLVSWMLLNKRHIKTLKVRKPCGNVSRKYT